MNNRGIKTRKNDFKRSLLLTKKAIKKLQEKQKEEENKKLQELEKKVKQIQIATFFKAVPVIISKTILKTIINNVEIITKGTQETQKKNTKLEENITINPSEEELEAKEEKQKSSEKEKLKQSSFEEVEIIPIQKLPKLEEVKNQNQEKKEEKKETEKKLDKELENLKTKKIIQNYEEKLKKERTQFKELAAAVPENKNGDDCYEKAMVVYQRLNLILQKLEELERKIKVDDQKYDDSYITYLIDLYTEEFQKGQIATDIKDSELYIAISKKLEEVENEKERIKKTARELAFKKQDEKKEKQEEVSEEKKEENIEEDSFDYPKKEKEYNDFQEEQKKILIAKEEKEEKARTEYEKMRTQVEAMKRQCHSLKKMISKRSFIKPSIRNAKLISVAVLTSVFFMKLVLRNKSFKRTRKILKRKEYQRSIEKNVIDMAATSHLINQSFAQIESLIEQIRTAFKNYPLQEYESLLIELENIKRILEERQYEIEQMKKNQETYQKDDQKTYRK